MYTILIIEQERSIRMALCYTLEDAGYEIYCTETFAEGYHLLRSIHFDVLIINYDILEKEKLHSILSYSTPVIFLTDLFGLPSKVAQSLPEFAYNLKLPFPLETFLSQVKVAINNKPNRWKSAITIPEYQYMV